MSFLPKRKSRSRGPKKVPITEGGKLCRELKLQVREALRNTVNRSAAAMQEEVLRTLPVRFHVKTKYTLTGIRMYEAEPGRRPVATVKTKSPYLTMQEEGGVRLPAQGDHVAIPSLRASGEGQGAGERKKAVRPKNKLEAIEADYKDLKPNNPSTKNPAKQLLLLQLKQAIKDGKNATQILYDGMNGLGLYDVTGLGVAKSRARRAKKVFRRVKRKVKWKQKTKSGKWVKVSVTRSKRVGRQKVRDRKVLRFKLRLLWALDQSSVKVKQSPWMGDTKDFIARTVVPKVMLEELRAALG